MTGRSHSRAAERFFCAVEFGPDRRGDRLYIFRRGDMFYPIALRDDADAIENAHHNPGTTSVEDINGRIVWERGKSS